MAAFGTMSRPVRDKMEFISGLQAELLKLLLSFHPFYLRLGLETVLSFNIGVGTGNKNYCKIFAAVVAQNLFNDPKILQDPKYVHGRTKYFFKELEAPCLEKRESFCILARVLSFQDANHRARCKTPSATFSDKNVPIFIHCV